MKKSFAWMMVAVLAFAAAGCAKKTAAEQLKDDMKKAGKEMNRQVEGFSK